MEKTTFSRLHPVKPEYATLPILEGFNWADCLGGVAMGQWYLVVFRSIRKSTADPARLRDFDDRAYGEATGSGLLAYFRGELNEQRQCLSLCLWESPEQAWTVTGQPSHRAAAALVDEMYEYFKLERWLLTKHQGRLELVPINRSQVVARGDGDGNRIQEEKGERLNATA